MFNDLSERVPECREKQYLLSAAHSPNGWSRAKAGSLLLLSSRQQGTQHLGLCCCLFQISGRALDAKWSSKANWFPFRLLVSKVVAAA